MEENPTQIQELIYPHCLYSCWKIHWCSFDDSKFLGTRRWIELHFQWLVCVSQKKLDDVTITEASELTKNSAKPIDDLRGTAEYRIYMIGVSAKRALEALAENTQGQELPLDPVLLWGADTMPEKAIGGATKFKSNEPIQTKINGKNIEFNTGHQKTLLRLIREEAGLTGTKEGCAEGECGACTVYLDGVAVFNRVLTGPELNQLSFIK